MGYSGVDCRQDRQHAADAAELGTSAQARYRDSLTQEEREQRTRDFEARQQADQEAMRAAAKIPPHVLVKTIESKPP